LGKAEEVLGRLTIKRIRRRWLDAVDRWVRNFSYTIAEEEEIGGEAAAWDASASPPRRDRSGR
jgi:hypothetical protein